MYYYDDVQIRLIILYALRSFKISMREEFLQEVLVWGGIIDYFTMMDFIFDMINLGMIKTVEIERQPCYDITGKGLELVGLFENKVPFSIRDRIDDRADELLNGIERGREIAVDIVPIDRRKFMARCGIYERGIPLLEINLFAGSRQSAEEIKNRFLSGAGDLYKTILERIVE